MKKKAIGVILSALILLSLVGCKDYLMYGGSHPELYVVAINSLLGVRGGFIEDILILEEDTYGRVMFAYVGGTSASDERTPFNILAVLIAQRTTETYSYFYSGINFILHGIAIAPRGQYRLVREFLSEGFVMERFSEEQLEQLKMENSWNEPLNENGFFRVPVSRGRKENYLTTVSRETQQETYLTAVEGANIIVEQDSIPLTMDKNGNVIFFMRGRRHDREETPVWVYYPAFLFMFDADGNLIEDTGIMELTDLWDYRDQLREFKEVNGWSFYYR